MLYRRYRAGKDEASTDEVPLHEWPFARFLSRSQAAGTLFLGLRLFLGWQWFHAGWEKLQNPAWMGGGTALRSYWENAVRVPAPPARPPITYPLYRAFLETLLQGAIMRLDLRAYGRQIGEPGDNFVPPLAQGADDCSLPHNVLLLDWTQNNRQ